MKKYLIPLVSLALSSLAFTGCASALKTTDFKEMKDSEAVIIGRFTVNRDGLGATNTCKLMLFRDGATFSDSYALDETGLVLFRLKRGTYLLDGIRCGTEEKNMANYYFDTKSSRLELLAVRGEYVYIGDTRIETAADKKLQVTTQDDFAKTIEQAKSIRKDLASVKGTKRILPLHPEMN